MISRIFLKFAEQYNSVDKYVNYLNQVTNTYLGYLAKAPPATFNPNAHDEWLEKARGYLLTQDNTKLFEYLKKNQDKMCDDSKTKFKQMEYHFGAAKAFNAKIHT